jgi:chromosome segregation ATPase
MQKLPRIKNYKVILVALLAGITIFSVYKYVQALREKYELLATLNQAKNQVSVLEAEKQNLLQTLEKEKQQEQKLSDEKAALKKNLKAASRKINKLSNGLEQASSQVTLLRSENTTLREERDKLVQENDNLHAKLGSVSGLKKAIMELRGQARNLGTKMKEQNESNEGNQGFVIKDGKPTITGKVKIEVTPVTPEAEPTAKNP